MVEPRWILGADACLEIGEVEAWAIRADGTRLRGPRALGALEGARQPRTMAQLQELGIGPSALDALCRIDVLVPADLETIRYALGAPILGVPAHDAPPATDALLGVPAVDPLRDSPGCAAAPDAIRAAAPELRLSRGTLFDPVRRRTLELPVPVRDLGNLSRRAWLPTLVAELSRDHRLLVLGGDHTLTWYGLAGLARRDGPFQLVHFDAHSDCATCPGQDRLNHASVIRHALDRLPLERLIQVGVRALEQHQHTENGEHHEGSDHQLAWSGGDRVHRLQPTADGPKDRRRLLSLLDPSLPLAVSVDLDVLDPSVAPEVSHPEPGGMLLPQLVDLLVSLEEAHPPVYLDLVEVDSGEAGPTARIAGRLLTEVLLARHGTPAPEGLPGLEPRPQDRRESRP